jgi:hypothetical protein
MAILDFIKNRQQQAAPKPAIEAAKPAPVKQDVSKVVPASELAKAREIGERLVPHPIVWTHLCSSCNRLKVLPASLRRRAVP